MSELVIPEGNRAEYVYRLATGALMKLRHIDDVTVVIYFFSHDNTRQVRIPSGVTVEAHIGGPTLPIDDTTYMLTSEDSYKILLHGSLLLYLKSRWHISTGPNVVLLPPNQQL